MSAVGRQRPDAPRLLQQRTPMGASKHIRRPSASVLAPTRPASSVRMPTKAS